MSETTREAAVSEAIAQWAHEYITAYRAVVEKLTNDAEFHAQAEAAVEKSQAPFWFQRTFDDYVRETVRRIDWPRPAFPAIATPAWAVEADVPTDYQGGQAVVMFYGIHHTCGNVSTRLAWGVHVVVDVTVPEETIGTYEWFDGNPTPVDDFLIENVDDPAVLRQYATVLASVAAQLDIIRLEVAA